MEINSFVARGNGACIIHDQLASRLDGYHNHGFSPWLGLVPSLPFIVNRKLVRQADVIHTVPEYGTLLGIPRQKSIVTTFHNFYTDSDYASHAGILRSSYYKTIMRSNVASAARRAAKVTVVSRYLYDKVKNEIGTSQIELIYNGIDTTLFKPARKKQETHEFRLLFVGNPIARKGFGWLAGLLDELPENYRLYYTTGMRTGQESVKHPNFIPIAQTAHSQMPSVYQSCDALLFPTLREGFGLAVAEAMACGLPVISTNVSAIPELVDDGKGGYLLEPTDMPGFIRAIRRLAENPLLREDMGSWNREKVVLNFPLSNMIDSYQSLFNNL